MVLGPALVAAAGVYVYLHGGRYESTDDAYVQAARVAISANVAGRVVAVDVRDNQRVRLGDVLFRLDDAPLRIAVDEARAQLAAARLHVAALKANYRQRVSELTAAQDALAYQRREEERQRQLLATGMISRSRADGARHAVEDAQAQVAAVKQQVVAVAASLGGDPGIAPERHPEVAQARARLDRAQLDLSYAVVRAPSDGIVTRVEQLQVGSHVAASAPVFALVCVDDVWVEANFKEGQLAHMRPGQPATVELDSYPGRIFRAKVASVSPGTGSQFSVLPAENATGNWVKVVQRLPVRVELEGRDPRYPLHGGLSASVRVDTGYRRHLLGGDEERRADASSARR